MKLICLAIFLVACAPMAFAFEGCPPGSKPPLEIFIDVVNSFRDEAILAKHKCVVDIWTTEKGCHYVSFETDMTSDDVPRKFSDISNRYLLK